MKIRKWVSCLCVAALVICMAGCSDSKDEDSAPASDEGSVQNEEESSQKTEVDLSDVYAAYAVQVQNDKESIDNYDWQRDVSSDLVKIQRQTALCDIDGDGVPELFLMEASDKYEASLHIYRYDNGEVSEMDYTVDSDEKALTDVQAAAGVNYVVFTRKTGEFCIYHTRGDESITYCLNTYRVKDGKIEFLSRVDNVYGPSKDNPDEISDVYHRNGKKISEKMGKTLFRKAFKDIDQAILFSGYDDTSIWSCFDTESALSMSSEKMIKKLEKGAEN